MNTIELKGFITNLGKYNEGELVGEWVTFPIDEEEKNELFKRIGLNHLDNDGNKIITGYEEYFFTDWDCDWMYKEYISIEQANEWGEILEKWDKETFLAAVAYDGFESVIETDCADWLLNPYIENDYDLGYYYAIEVGCIDFSGQEELENYFDFESYGRDMRINSNGNFTKYGWIEYIG